MKKCILIILVLITLSVHSPADNAPAVSGKDPQPVRAEEIARSYTHLNSMTKKPVYVDPYLAMLCRGVDQRDAEEARKASGPHALTTVSIYMDDSAAEAFRKGSKSYSPGAIIVKEKKGHVWASGGKSGQIRSHDGVGGMIKRAKGYDADHGDWEYFYFEDPAKVESGKIASCVQCHATAVKTDYVFGGWAKAEER